MKDEIKKILEELWSEHYNFSEFDGKYHAEDMKGFFDQATAKIVGLLTAMKGERG